MFIEPQHLEMVKNILQNHVPNLEILAFGSRVHGEHFKKFSDLDLAIISENPISFELMYALKNDFSESYLPFKVDVLDWASISDNFKKIIMERYETIQTAKK